MLVLGVALDGEGRRRKATEVMEIGIADGRLLGDFWEMAIDFLSVLPVRYRRSGLSDMRFHDNKRNNDNLL